MPHFAEHRLIHRFTGTKPTRQVTEQLRDPKTGMTYTQTQSGAQANAGNQAAQHQTAIAGAVQNGPTGTIAAPTGDLKMDVLQEQQNYYTKHGATSPELEAYAFNRGLTDVRNLAPITTAGVTETAEQFEARKAAIIAQNTEIMKQQKLAAETAATKAAKSAAGAAAGAKATTAPTAAAPSASVQNPNTGQSYSGAAGQRLQGRLDRQDFIEQQRAAGRSDAEIRTMLDSMPPEQTSTPANTENSVQMETSVPMPETPKEMPAGPSKDGEAGTPAVQPAPAVDPNSGLLRAIAATVEDPIMRAILSAEADRADMLAMSDPMGQAQFNQGADAKVIAKPYDAIDSILNRAYNTAEKTYSAQQTFLKGQYDRNEKLMADREENTKNQLAFANDKSIRDQKDVNKKLIDSQTIMLALEGGFGSHDGNLEIADARLKGEQAIIDLNKEFGFKNTDVSLAFTEMHNQAFDGYQQAWLTATDNFEARVSNLDLQGISNQQAKATALSSAYKDYVTEIKDARKEQAKIISDATKMVYDAIVKEKAAKQAEARWQYEQSWQEYAFNEQQARLSEQFGLQMADRQDARVLQLDTKEEAAANKKVNDIRSKIEQNKIMTPYRKDIQPLYENAKKAIESGDNFLADRALAKIYEKMVEPNSVVMPGEYLDIAGSAPFLSKIQGKFNKVLNGGQAWTGEERTELFDLVGKFHDTYKTRYDEAAQQFYTDIDWHNRNTVNPSYQITPDQVGLPVVSTQKTRSVLEQNLPENYTPRAAGSNPFRSEAFSAPPPKTSGITEKDLTSATIGGKQIKAQPYVVEALRRADAELFAATGQRLQINQHFRDAATQARIFKELSAKGARVAPPGKSFHEKGLAIDITNWKEAAPFLRKYNIVNGLEGDMGHFSIGEMNPQILDSLS